MYFYTNNTYYFVVKAPTEYSSVVEFLISSYQTIYDDTFIEGNFEYGHSKYMLFEPTYSKNYCFNIYSVNKTNLIILNSSGTIVTPYSDEYIGNEHYIKYNLSCQKYYIKLYYETFSSYNYDFQIIDVAYTIDWSAINKEYLDMVACAPAEFVVDSYGIDPYEFDFINHTVKFSRIECYWTITGYTWNVPEYYIGILIGEWYTGMPGLSITGYGEPSFYDPYTWNFYGYRTDVLIELSPEEWDLCVREILC